MTAVKLLLPTMFIMTELFVFYYSTKRASHLIVQTYLHVVVALKNTLYFLYLKNPEHILQNVLHTSLVSILWLHGHFATILELGHVTILSKKGKTVHLSFGRAKFVLTDTN